MIGIVTGFRAEARCLPGSFGTVVCSGASALRAERLAEGLARGGARLLISFGVAGALEPALASGDLVIPEAVLTPLGDQLACDPGLRTGLVEALAKSGLGPSPARLLVGSGTIVATPEARRSLFARTGAAAVDMESHAVADAAATATLPFLVVRAVADTAWDQIPDLATRSLRPDGRTDVSAVVRGLLAQPGQLPDLLRLAGRTRRALTTLRRTGPVLQALATGP